MPQDRGRLATAKIMQYFELQNKKRDYIKEIHRRDKADKKPKKVPDLPSKDFFTHKH